MKIVVQKLTMVLNCEWFILPTVIIVQRLTMVLNCEWVILPLSLLTLTVAGSM